MSAPAYCSWSCSMRLFISFMNYPIGAVKPTGAERGSARQDHGPHGADRAALSSPAESQSALTPARRGGGSIPAMGVKIGGTTLKIRLGIQWNVSAKWDSLCAGRQTTISARPWAPCPWFDSYTSE
jgi:hypothetical protein